MLIISHEIIGHFFYLFMIILFFQEPNERVLNRYFVNNNCSGRSQEKIDCCYDIPLIDSLELLLNCSTVHEQVSLCYSFPAVQQFIR